jgi:hypothetical protein
MLTVSFTVPITRCRLTGTINYTPFVKPLDAHYSNADQMCIRQNLKYGDVTILESGVGVLEFMNTLLLLATEHFEAYQKATGASLDEYVYHTS